ncbi:MAG: hypothetical protein AB7N54_11700 [Alphaproteobacteria bacterium]
MTDAATQPPRTRRARELARWARFVLALWLALPGLHFAAATLDAGASGGLLLCTARGLERLPVEAGQPQPPRDPANCLACAVVCAGALAAAEAGAGAAYPAPRRIIVTTRFAAVPPGVGMAAHQPRAPPAA